MILPYDWFLKTPDNNNLIELTIIWLKFEIKVFFLQSSIEIWRVECIIMIKFWNHTLFGSSLAKQVLPPQTTVYSSVIMLLGVGKCLHQPPHSYLPAATNTGLLRVAHRVIASRSAPLPGFFPYSLISDEKQWSLATNSLFFLTLSLSLFPYQIKAYEKTECHDERRKQARDIYDNFIMKEMLSHTHVSIFESFFLLRGESVPLSLSAWQFRRSFYRCLIACYML